MPSIEEKTKLIRQLNAQGLSRQQIIDSLDNLDKDLGYTKENPVQSPPVPQAQEPSMQQAILPRATEAPTTGRKIAGGLADLLSLPGRASSAEYEKTTQPIESFVQEKTGFPGLINLMRGKKVEEPTEKGFKELVSETKGENIGENIVKSPATGAALLTAPFTGGGSIGALLKGGAIEGTAAATGSQAERFAEQGDVSPKEAGAEVLLNVLLPVFGKGVATGLKKTGVSIAERGLKLTKSDAKAGAKVENLFENKIVGGLDKSIEKVQERIQSLGDELTKRVKGKEELVNLNEVYQKAQNELLQEVEKGKHTDIADDIIRQLDALKAKMDLVEPTGVAPVEKLLEIKRSWGNAGKFQRDVPPDLNARQIVANKLNRSFNEKLLEIVPEAKEINKELSQLIPLEPALREASRRIGKNDLVSLGDLMAGTLGGGVGYNLFGGQGSMALGVGLPIATMGARRALKSPAVGAASYGTGELLQNKGLQFLINRGATQENNIEQLLNFLKK